MQITNEVITLAAETGVIHFLLATGIFRAIKLISLKISAKKARLAFNAFWLSALGVVLALFFGHGLPVLTGVLQGSIACGFVYTGGVEALRVKKTAWGPGAFLGLSAFWALMSLLIVVSRYS